MNHRVLRNAKVGAWSAVSCRPAARYAHAGSCRSCGRCWSRSSVSRFCTWCLLSLSSLVGETWSEPVDENNSWIYVSSLESLVAFYQLIIFAIDSVFIDFKLLHKSTSLCCIPTYKYLKIIKNIDKELFCLALTNQISDKHTLCLEEE